MFHPRNAEHHSKNANSIELQRLWAFTANQSFARYRDNDRAIRTANMTIKNWHDAKDYYYEDFLDDREQRDQESASKWRKEQLSNPIKLTCHNLTNYLGEGEYREYGDVDVLVKYSDLKNVYNFELETFAWIALDYWDGYPPSGDQRVESVTISQVMPPATIDEAILFQIAAAHLAALSSES